MKRGSKKKVHKKTLYLPVFNGLKKGESLLLIRNGLDISKQQINYYLRGLIKDKLIEKIGRGKYKVKERFEHTRNKKREIRGHAFIWTLKLNRKYDWIKILNKRNIKFKLIRGLIPRIMINNRKLWLGKKTITIYEPHSFYGINAVESRKYAVVSLLEQIEALEKRIETSLYPYIFKPAREHYGIIKNDLAIQCNRNKEKIHIRDDLEGEWLWIDDSLGLGELENKSPLRNIQVQRWFNDHKRHNFKVTPSFLLESINQVTQNQAMFNQNFESHVKSIRQLGNSADANAKSIELLADVVLQLKDGLRK